MGDAVCIRDSLYVTLFSGIPNYIHDMMHQNYFSHFPKNLLVFKYFNVHLVQTVLNTGKA